MISNEVRVCKNDLYPALGNGHHIVIASNGNKVVYLCDDGFVVSDFNNVDAINNIESKSVKLTRSQIKKIVVFIKDLVEEEYNQEINSKIKVLEDQIKKLKESLI